MSLSNNISNKKFCRDLFLTDIEKAAYDALCRSVAFRSQSADVPLDLTDNQFQKIFLFFYFDNPQFYYVNFSRKLDHGDGLVHFDNITPYYIPDYPKEYFEIIDSIVNQLKEETKEMNDYDKAFHIFSFLAHKCFYDNDAFRDANCSNPQIRDENLASFNLIGPLVHSKGVCQGLAIAYLYLLFECGVESYIQRCDLDKVSHCFNVVILKTEEGEKKINVDLTLSVKKEEHGIGPVGRMVYPVTTWGFGVSNDTLRNLKYVFYDPTIESDGSLSYLKLNNLEFNELPDVRKYIRKLEHHHAAISLRYDGDYSEERMKQFLLQIAYDHGFKGTVIISSPPFYTLYGGDLYE